MNAFYKNWWQVMRSKVFFNNAVQAFLDFRNFPFNVVYDSNVSPHQQHKSRNACIQK